MSLKFPCTERNVMIRLALGGKFDVETKTKQAKKFIGWIENIALSTD